MYIKKVVYSSVAVIILTSLYFYQRAGFPFIQGSGKSVWASSSVVATSKNPDAPVYYKVPVLIFHNIDGAGQYSIKTEEFIEILNEIREKDINILSMQDLMKMSEKGQYPDRPSIVISFDDDYKNIVRIAAPLMRDYRIPGTFYAYIQNISEEERAGYSWSDLNRLLGEGFEVQNHSYTHTAFHKARPGESAENYENRVRREISLSREILNSKLIKEVYAFALPMGYKSPYLMNRLKEEGYDLVLLADGNITDLREPYDGSFDRVTIQTIPGISPLEQLRRTMKKTQD